MNTEFKCPDLERLGLKRTMVQQWEALGYVAPSIQQASGQGTRKIWSLGDVKFMLAFQAMVAAGFSRDSAAGILRRGGL